MSYFVRVTIKFGVSIMALYVSSEFALFYHQRREYWLVEMDLKAVSYLYVHICIVDVHRTYEKTVKS